MLTVNRQEIYRYLGYGMQEPDAEVRRAVEDCLTFLIPQLETREVHRAFSLQFTGRNTLDIGGLVIQSSALAKNLDGCSEVCMMAATVGFAPDRLSARAAAAGKVSRSLMYLAAGTALIEAWCDQVSGLIREEFAGQGLYPRPRFSPGYGDFALEYQQDLMQMLRVQKTIGVTLTESLLMMPSKSVTALIGLSVQDEQCTVSGCEVCAKAASCSYRRF
ncbi:MAG: Vitamin B12 dependent methionine synthase activation subunit [Eubacterium sp.]|nr:Vitamin B12 dependent methionine synthase activation subunit [Eubacterium sp.]